VSRTIAYAALLLSYGHGLKALEQTHWMWALILLGISAVAFEIACREFKQSAPSQKEGVDHE